MSAEITKNDRGFERYGEFVESRGRRVWLVESSVVGDPHCYLFCQEPGTREDMPPHMTVEQAEMLVKMLNLFIASARSPDHRKNSAEYMETFRKVTP